MREIRFRGWDVKYNRWVYGYYEMIPVGIGFPTELIHEFNDWNLSAAHKIYPDSVGQFTGLKDMKGVDVYEGDILNWSRWEEELTDAPDVYIVAWDHKVGGWYLQCCRDGKQIESTDLGDRVWGDIDNPLHDMRVVANTFQNKELVS